MELLHKSFVLGLSGCRLFKGSKTFPLLLEIRPMMMKQLLDEETFLTNCCFFCSSFLWDTTERKNSSFSEMLAWCRDL